MDTSQVIALRREFHTIAEVGFKEKRTSERILQILQNTGLKAHYFTNTGVVGVLEGLKERPTSGKTLMIRADIDGLPITEDTNLPFASTSGTMHACGHDAHIAIALQTANILYQYRKLIHGRIAFVFQPAEEVVGGAIAMIKHGLIDQIQPDRVIGLHVWNRYPVGTINLKKGTVFASADAFRILVHGQGGHGALPHLSIDPIVIAAHIITMSQTIVSRKLPPNDMGVLTFGSISGGNAPNIIPNSVTVEGTVRAYNEEIRSNILQSLERIAIRVADSFGATVSFDILYGTPPVINDTNVVEWIRKNAIEMFGKEKVSNHEPISVGDDMSEFLKRIPGAYIMLGAEKANSGLHHNPRFDIAEECMPIGVELFVKCALDYLE